MAVSVITDSTAYLPAEIINRYNIKVVPLNVHLPDQVFKESQGLSNTQYYNLLRNNKLFPTTSQPSAGEFFEIFNGLSPGEEAVAILISSHLSGTVQSALIARDMLAEGQEAITIIDSLSTSMGLGFQVIKACEGLAQGKTVSQIHREVLAVGQRMRLLFMVDNLEYLVRGGRVSKIGGLLGNILQLKPILHVSQGEIALFDRVRTAPKAIKKVLEELDKKKNELEKIAVIHVDAPEEAIALKKIVEASYSLPIVVSEVGPVIGTHAGPGALGLAFY